MILPAIPETINERCELKMCTMISNGFNMIEKVHFDGTAAVIYVCTAFTAMTAESLITVRAWLDECGA